MHTLGADALSDAALRVKSAYRKVVISGSVVELYEMDSKPYSLKTQKSDVDWIREMETEIEEAKMREAQENWEALTDAEKESVRFSMGRQEFGKLQRNIMRTRNTVRRLILSNFDNTAKFWTFTFDNQKVPPHVNEDVQATNVYWKQFIQRMRRQFGGFKYLTVLEFQKRGAVHYHCLTDLPYVKQSLVQEIWANGFVSGNRIKHVDNLGAYLVKYMTKDLSDPRMFGNKTYQCSKGLQRPEEFRGLEAEKVIAALDLGQKKEVFTSSYPSEYLGLIRYKEYNLSREQ